MRPEVALVIENFIIPKVDLIQVLVFNSNVHKPKQTTKYNM